MRGIYMFERGVSFDERFGTTVANSRVAEDCNFVEVAADVSSWAPGSRLLVLLPLTTAFSLFSWLRRAAAELDELREPEAAPPILERRLVALPGVIAVGRCKASLKAPPLMCLELTRFAAAVLNEETAA